MNSDARITATMPCRHCDATISAIAEICPHCGVRQFEGTNVVRESAHSTLTAALLCFLLGVFGAHRFYVGKTKSAILQLLTLGGLGIWMLVDLVLILTGQFRDADGNKLGASI